MNSTEYKQAILETCKKPFENFKSKRLEVVEAFIVGFREGAATNGIKLDFGLRPLAKNLSKQHNILCGAKSTISLYNLISENEDQCFELFLKDLSNYLAENEIKVSKSKGESLTLERLFYSFDGGYTIKRQLNTLRAYCIGVNQIQKVLGGDGFNFSELETWLQAEYSMPKNVSWDSIILFFSENSYSKAYDKFYEILAESHIKVISSDNETYI